MSRQFFIGMLLLSLFCLSGADQQTPPIASPQDAVRMLGDRRFANREAAMRWLWEAGEDVAPLLERAADSSDREVSGRARLLLERLALGIRPDTPANVIREIRAYRDGDEREKAETLKRLLHEGQPEVAVRLIQYSLKKNEQWIESQVELVLPHLVLTNQHDLAERLLRQAAASGQQASLYRAFLVVNGRIDNAISNLEEAARRAPEMAQLQQLALLYRAKGDMKRAVATARKFADRHHGLLEVLLTETGQFDELANRLASRLDLKQTPTRDDLARVGYLLAFHQAAGHKAEVDELTKRLLKWQTEIPKSDITIVRLLLTNGRFQEALPLVAKDDPLGHFSLLTQFERWDDAFEWLGIKSLDDPALDKWFEARMPKAIKGRRHAPDEFEEVTEVCRVLGRLGAKAQAARHLDRLAQGLLELPNHFWTSEVGAVIERELDLSLRDQAFDHALKILTKGSAKSILSTIYPDDQALAIYWWNRLRDESRGDPYATTLRQLRQVMDRQLEVGELRTRIEQRCKALLPQGAEAVEEELPHLTQTLRNYGQLREAIRLLETYDSQGRYYSLLGDMWAELEQWREAAQAYEEAVQTQPDIALARFLAGLCWQRAGESQLAQQHLAIANQLVLPPLERVSIGDELVKRHWNDEAVRQWLLVVQTVDPDSENEAIYGYALRKLYLSSVEEEVPTHVKLHAWRWTLWRTMEPEMFVANVGIYPYFVFQIRFQRAKQLLEQDDLDGALEFAQSALEAAPAAIEVAELFVPELEKRGRPEDAEKLFQRTDELMMRLCQRFPNSALYANNLAWMYARCRRKLDDAYKLATRAVELEPETATYLDTLAEVEFCRGNVQRALALAQRCIELDPSHSHYRRQLRRFTAALESPNRSK